MRALSAVCDHAHRHESGDHDGWEDVQEAAQELINAQDMGLFETMVEYPGTDKYIDRNEAYDIHNEWERYVKRGKTLYCSVSVGTMHREENEAEEEHSMLFEESSVGREYYAAYQQWHAFGSWLETRTAEEREMVREFEVSAIII